MGLQARDRVDAGAAPHVEQVRAIGEGGDPRQVRGDVPRATGQGERQRPRRGLGLHRRLDPLAEDECRPLLVAARARRPVGAEPLDHLDHARRPGREPEVAADPEIGRHDGRCSRASGVAASRPTPRRATAGVPCARRAVVSTIAGRSARPIASRSSSRSPRRVQDLEDPEVRDGRRQQLGAVAASEVLEDGRGVGRRWGEGGAGHRRPQSKTSHPKSSATGRAKPDGQHGVGVQDVAHFP